MLSVFLIILGLLALEKLLGTINKNVIIYGCPNYFKSSLKSIENPDPDIPLTGDASSGITHNMVMDVEQVNSSFTTSFSTKF